MLQNRNVLMVERNSFPSRNCLSPKSNSIRYSPSPPVPFLADLTLASSSVPQTARPQVQCPHDVWHREV